MRRLGFTLLEVIVALGILAVSLTAIMTINSQALSTHVYVHKLTIATWLARSKMIDLQQKLYDKPLNADDEESGGDFTEEGWPSFKWRARVLVPRTQNVSIPQIMGALFGLPLGGGPGGSPSLLSALFPDGGTPSGPTTAGGSSLGAFAGLAEAQMQQMLNQIQNSVREVRLTVAWKDGNNLESFDLVTHIVSLGPGSDRNAPGSNQPAWVRTDGSPAQGPPTPCPNGQGLCDRDGTPLRPSNAPTGAAQAPALGAVGAIQQALGGGIR